MAVMMMTIANGGTRYTPHVLKSVDEGQGWKPVPPPPPGGAARMKDSTIKALHDGLWMVVNAAGTGGRGRIIGLDVAGKTGTAQVISLTGAKVARGKMDVRDHGWFVFFAPKDNPEIAGVVFAEHAEHGYLARADCEVRDRDVLREEGRTAAAVPCETARDGAHRRRRGRGSHAGRRAGRRSRSGANGHAGWGDTVRCSNDGCSSTSTGSCSAPCCCSPGSAWR